jgi:phospholipid/cholesterol/gamma-HCH transport system ATP-binding protein
MPEVLSESVLRFEGVTLRFDDEETALDNISFAVNAGESCVILGSAGSGKTVLLKTALGLLEPDEGQVYVFGRAINELPEAELMELRSRIGVLFQEGGLFDSLTIEENVGYPLVNQKAIQCPPDQVRPRVEEALRFVELGHTLDKFPSELSGGMRRRVGIARANVTRSPLVLYDSPTAGLDPITAHTIMVLILKERDTKNTTTAMVTHRYQDGHLLANYRYTAETGRLAPASTNGSRTDLRTKFLVLREGRLVFEGRQQELENSTDSYVQRFVKRLGD